MIVLDLDVCWKDGCREPGVTGGYCWEHHYRNCDAFVAHRENDKPAECNCHELERRDRGQT